MLLLHCEEAPGSFAWLSDDNLDENDGDDDEVVIDGAVQVAAIEVRPSSRVLQLMITSPDKGGGAGI